MKKQPLLGRVSVKNILPFLMGMLLFWVLLAAFIFYNGHGQSFLLLRPGTDTSFDLFFAFTTYLGDGIFVVLLALFLLLKRRFDWAFVIFAGYALSGILAQIIKALAKSWRPAPFFQQLGISIHQVEGIALLQSNNSMPSGHTASAFALATALVLVSKWWNRRWWLAALLAIFVGYSRVFLGQHFPADVLVGSVLGVASSIIAGYVLWRWNPGFLQSGKPSHASASKAH